MRGNELVGLSASCDPPAQKVLAVTHTMISRFLEQARTGNYIGFPADGTQVTELTDPVFRKFLGLSETGGGFLRGETACLRLFLQSRSAYLETR